MFKYNSFIVSFIFVFLISHSNLYSQTYGKIFKKNVADQKFGVVLESVTLTTTDLRGLLNQTNNYLMFKIVSGQAIVLNNNRNVLHPIGNLVNVEDVFTMFSVSIINDLLTKSNNNIVFVEQRSGVLSITNGGYTLEVGVKCPPICDDD
ncbi:MAG: hypothetical protein ACW98D_19650 [Promethearchaeota archaeon]